MEVYFNNIYKHFNKYKFIVISRKLFESDNTINNNDLKIIYVPYFKGKWLRGPSFILFSFLKALSIDFDILYSHGILASFIAYILKIIKKKPLILIPHGSTYGLPVLYGKIISKIFTFAERITYENADHIIFNSDFEMHSIIKHLQLKNKKISVINPGIYIKPASLSKEQLFNKLGLDMCETVILFAGRLTPGKGIETLIHAISTLPRDIEYRLIVAGAGPLLDKCKQLVSKLKIENRIVFLGYIDHDYLQEIRWHTDIYVHPSQSEGFPLSLLESMYCKNAIIASNIGLPIIHNKTGILFQSENIQELHNAILFLVKNPLMQKQLKINLSSEMMGLYSWNNTALKTINVFQKY